MKDLQFQLEQIEKRVTEELKEIKIELKVASKFTQKFLNKCGKAGVTRVSIGKKTKAIPRTEKWPFGFGSSVFSYPENIRDKSGWPAIWGIVKELKISGGAGNPDQHQVSGDNLLEGVYKLKNRQWKRIE